MYDLILYVGKHSVQQDDLDSLWALVGCVQDKTVCVLSLLTLLVLKGVCGVICHCRVDK